MTVNPECGLWTPDAQILNGDQVLRKLFISLDSHKADRHEERKLLICNKFSHYMQCNAHTNIICSSEVS